MHIRSSLAIFRSTEASSWTCVLPVQVLRTPSQRTIFIKVIIFRKKLWSYITSGESTTSHFRSFCYLSMFICLHVMFIYLLITGLWWGILEFGANTAKWTSLIQIGLSRKSTQEQINYRMLVWRLDLEDGMYICLPFHFDYSVVSLWDYWLIGLLFFRWIEHVPDGILPTVSEFSSQRPSSPIMISYPWKVEGCLWP